MVMIEHNERFGLNNNRNQIDRKLQPNKSSRRGTMTVGSNPTCRSEAAYMAGLSDDIVISEYVENTMEEPRRNVENGIFRTVFLSCSVCEYFQTLYLFDLTMNDG